MSPRAAVLGAGRWGYTLAWLLGRSGHDVALWSSDPAKASRLQAERRAKLDEAPELPPSVSVTSSLDAAIEAPLVVLAVQPAATRDLLRGAAPSFRPEHRVVHAVKGFDRAGHPVSRLIQEETRVLQVGALAGPVVPTELWRGEDSAAVIGSGYQALVDEVTELLSSSQVRVYGTLDLLGVEVGGAMRTPLAVAAGMLVEAGLGRSLHAVLLTRGIAEAARLAESLGADHRTLSGLSGVGDWMLTTTDPVEPLVLAGRALARGEGLGHPEAEARVRTLLQLSSGRGVDLPITEAVGAVLDGTPLEQAFQELMTRAARPEAE